MKSKVTLLVGLMMCARLLPAQDIPLGTWRMHISYTNIHTVAVTPTHVYAAASNGIMVLNVADKSITTLDKQAGLSNTNITQVAFDQPRDQLLVTYADGDIDIIRNQVIINFNTLKNATTITGSKRINHITLRENLAYLSTDFGVVVFDLQQLAVKETWRDIGPGGVRLEINESTFYNDSVFLATNQGVLAGGIDNNLLDYNNWKRFTAGALNGEIQSIATFNETVYAAVNGSGIYAYNPGAWQLQPYLQGLLYKTLTAAGTLLVTAGSNLYSVSTTGVVTTITSAKIANPQVAHTDSNGKFWIGDSANGLVSNTAGDFTAYTANGPTFSAGLRMEYEAATGALYAVPGGFNATLSPLGIKAQANVFSGGQWTALQNELDEDLTDIAFFGNTVFISSHGYGLEKTGPNHIVYNAGNSPLQNAATGNNVRVTAIETARNGLWVANAGVSPSLHLLQDATTDTWQSVSLPFTAARYPTGIQVDLLGNVWMPINHANGGGIVVYNPGNGQSAYLTETANAGGLPSRNVYAIAIDRDGFVWVGTAAGVAYFPDPSRVFSSNINAIRPIFENNYLLRDERVTAIEIDGGNRKWMGTENGVWLFNAFAETQLHNFNTANSPLLSNKIIDLEINSRSGELFIMTDAGIVSFRSNATPGETRFSRVKIFPNPVTNQFNGQVGISGLVTDAIVKITDVSGKLVWQATANGGMTSWNVRDYNNRRAATGIYLVFCITQDGVESLVGKVAVVN